MGVSTKTNIAMHRNLHSNQVCHLNVSLVHFQDGRKLPSGDARRNACEMKILHAKLTFSQRWNADIVRIEYVDQEKRSIVEFLSLVLAGNVKNDDVVLSTNQSSPLLNMAQKIAGIRSFYWMDRIFPQLDFTRVSLKSQRENTTGSIKRRIQIGKYYRSNRQSQKQRSKSIINRGKNRPKGPFLPRLLNDFSSKNGFF
jgi:hypothetical protein